MSALDELLDLQEHDTVIDQLEHRLATLPERDAVDRIDAELAGHEKTVDSLENEKREFVREQTKLEDNISLVEDKRATEEAKLYDGSVSAIKELQALQDELAALKRRQTSLEDDLLEILEAIEPLDEQLEALAAEGVQKENARSEAAASLETAQTELDIDLLGEQEKRAAAAAGVPAEMVAEYEQLRQRLRGVAVARLSGGSCMGCHLALSAVEVDRIKKLPPDEPVHCEECGRILVR